MLAKLPDSILSRYIFDRRYVLAESREGYVNYKYDGGFYLDFNFLSSKNYLSINIYHHKRSLDAFVVELLDREPGRGAVHDCRNDSVSWMQERIFKCRGFLKVRNLTDAETEQMEGFIDDFQSKNYFSGQLVIPFVEILIAFILPRNKKKLQVRF